MRMFNRSQIGYVSVFLLLIRSTKSDTTLCQCGATELSKDLFLSITDDQTCDALSDCVINGITVDAKTFNATKAFNCTSSCFQYLGTVPAPDVSLNSSPLPPKSGLSHTALVAIVVGAAVFILFIACVISIWLRRKKRAKKKYNRSIASRNNLVMQEDLRAIVTVGDESSSRNIKINPKNRLTDINRGMSTPQTSASSHYYRKEPVEYESGDESVGSTKEQHTNTQSHVISHPIELTGSPQWDNSKPILADESYSTTDLGQYLHTQGFLGSDRLQDSRLVVREI